MIKVLETFSGIGSQAKALERLNINFEIIATADWDINAIIAYDLIHNGTQDLTEYDVMSKEAILNELSKYTLSPDGKSPYGIGNLSRNSIGVLRCLLCAINRTKNLVSITDMTSENIPEDLDILTYSFPCQDLSIAGVWHGNMSGIDRDIFNRSGMLWEVERLLKECVNNKKNLPKFLLMENVSNILASRHMDNFQEWIDYLSNNGYYSKIYRLNASKFGIPQKRERVFMLSINIGSSAKKSNILDAYFNSHNLQDDNYVKSLPLKKIKIEDILKTDYDKKEYKIEADLSQLHDTPSRRKIVEENDKILENGEYIGLLKTITTKQDRNPNSGVIEYKSENVGKLEWRYLTARECFIAMGFDEKDYEIVVNNNIDVAKNRKLFSENKLIKMAGNSIVVNVLEAIFMQIIDIMSLPELGLGDSNIYKSVQDEKYSISEIV